MREGKYKKAIQLKPIKFQGIMLGLKGELPAG
jgi:hypothetical protein